MSIDFLCENCRRLLELPPSMKGASVRCPSCQTVLTVPPSSTVDKNDPSLKSPVPSTEEDKNRQKDTEIKNPTPLASQEESGEVIFLDMNEIREEKPEEKKPARFQVRNHRKFNLQPPSSPPSGTKREEKSQKAAVSLEAPNFSNPTEKAVSSSIRPALGGAPKNADSPIPSNRPSEEPIIFRAKVEIEEKEPFWTDLGGLFFYPLRDSGAVSILLSAVFFTGVFFVLQYAIFVGLPAIIMLWGYIFAYFFKITRRTILGDQVPPNWPGLSEAGSAFFKVAMVHIVYLVVPILLFVYLCYKFQIPPLIILLGILGILFLGLFCIPMALLLLAIFENLGSALNPSLIFESILKIFGHYMLAVLFLYFLSFLSALFSSLTRNVPYAGIAQFCIYFYFSMIYYRLLGVMYLSCRKRLAWE